MKRLVVFFLCLVAWSAQAQQDSPQQHEKWTLQECIDYALQHNLQVKKAELSVENADIVRKGTKFSGVPNLNASTNFSKSTGRSIDPFTNTIIDNNVNSQNMSLNTNATLFNWLKIVHGTKRDAFSAEAAEYDLEDTKNTVSLNVATYFINILFNQEQLKAAQFRLSSTTSELGRVQKQVDAGSLPISNLLQIKQQQASDKVSLVQAQNSLAASYLNLKQALQLPATESLEIEAPDLENIDMTPPAMKAGAIYNIAVEQQPQIRAADDRVASSKFGIKAARADYFPSLGFNAGISSAYSSSAPDQLPKSGAANTTVSVPVGYVQGSNTPVLRDETIPTEFKNNDYLNQLDYNQRRFISLSLNIPIFNRFQVRNNVQRSKISLENSQIDAESARNQLRQTIEKAWQDAMAASQTYQANMDNVKALEDTYQNAQKRFELGAMSAIDYTKTKNDYEAAKSDLIRSKFDFIFKQKILDFYQGKELSF